MMPLEVKTAVEYRREFVVLAIQDGANIRELCRRFRFAPATAYKWINRYQSGGVAALDDQSRRPHHSPRQTDPEREARVLALRDAHPTWGGRKLHERLVTLGMTNPPAASTITDLLRRTGHLVPSPSHPGAVLRFERPAPNELWQLDFMGHKPLATGRVHPLTMLDDHSRFGLLLVACANQRRVTVQAQLTACFERYGMPWTILADNGTPWGTSGNGGISGLEAWFLQLGITLVHGRAYHPQTQGKIERWHRTINQDVFGPRPVADLPQAQSAFDRFRIGYNTERPHQALDGAVPASRYSPSRRTFSAILPPIVYDDDDTVHTVRAKGDITVNGERQFISEGLAGLPVALRPTTTDGVLAVRFLQREITTIDLRARS